MKQIPNTQQALLIRTDFSSDHEWQKLISIAQSPVGDFQATFDVLDDKDFEGIQIDDIISLPPEDVNHTFLLIADHITFTDNERTILVLDLSDELGRTFRVIPSCLWEVENNLTLANMEFIDLADNVDQNGVFRGFL